MDVAIASAGRDGVGRRPGVGGALLAACPVVGGVSLVLSGGLSSDPWGWLIWGGELTSGRFAAFSTVGYPSWKPLPVAFTAVFSLFGGAAPVLWLWLARSAGLAGVVLALLVAARFAGPVGGVVAAVALVSVSGWVAGMAGGASEPMLVALVLGAVYAHLAGRRGWAWALGFLAALVRPEVWPFLLLYAIVLWRRKPRWRVAVALLLVAIPALWLIPDWVGSGDPFHGSSVAGRSGEAIALRHDSDPTMDVATGSAADVLAPVLAAALFACALAWRRRERALLWLAAAAGAWLVLVVGLSAAGFAGLPRFALPAAGVLCVVGGVGAGWALRLPSRRWVGVLLGLVLLAITVPFALHRGRAIGRDLAAVRTEVRLGDQLASLTHHLGTPSTVLARGHPLTRDTFQTRLGWQLGIPAQDTRIPRLPAVLFTLRSVSLHLPGPFVIARPLTIRPLAQHGRWEALAVARQRPDARSGGASPLSGAQ